MMSNSATKSVSYYVEKRPGLVLQATVAAGSAGTAMFFSPSTGAPISAFGATNSTLYYSSTSVGTITGLCHFITETQINGVTYFLFTSSDGTGWYLVNGADADTSFTGDTHTNTTIDNIAGSGGVYVGQLISGTGIAANTRVATRTPDTATPTSITTTVATTATAAGVTITKTPIAKIIDANFPTAVGGFALLDGYVFVMTGTGRVYQSNLNDVITWGAQNYITANISTDTGMGVIKYKNHIVAFGNESVEFFFNSGNPSGSVLASRKDLFSQVGLYAGGGSFQSVLQINDNVFWIGNDMGLYTFDEFTPKKLAEQGMALGSGSSGLSYPPYALSAFRIGVDTIINISNSTAAGKWFSVKNNMWFEPNFGTFLGIIFANYPTPTSIFLAYAVRGGTSGKVYSFQSDTYQDEGTAFSLIVQTEPKVLNKGKGFKITYIDLLADTQSSGETTLEISRDDYGTWQVLGVFNLTKTRKRIYRCGYCRSSAALRLTDSGNNAWRGQALIVNYESC